MKPQGKINKSGLSSESLTVDRHLEGSKLFIRIVCILQLKFDCNQWIQTFWTIHFKPPCNKAHFYAYKRMFKQGSKFAVRTGAVRGAVRTAPHQHRQNRIFGAPAPHQHQVFVVRGGARSKIIFSVSRMT